MQWETARFLNLSGGFVGEAVVIAAAAVVIVFFMPRGADQQTNDAEKQMPTRGSSDIIRRAGHALVP